ncbi:MAG: hypothetical protein WEA58_03860 [Balneolaceae bacterium]
MCNQLKTLSKNQLVNLIKKSIDGYHDEDYDYTIKDLNSPNVNSTEEKITFKVEIRCKESVRH